MQTPCDTPQDWLDENGKWTKRYVCPYSDDPTSETCRCWCGSGVDEDDYPEDDYPEEEEDYE